MGELDGDIELLKKLMEAGQFPARNAALSARGAAAIALTLMCGVPITALVRLARAHWRPGGRDAVVVDPEGQYADMRGAKARAVPLLGTPMTVVERYLALAPPGGPDAPLLQAERGGPCAANAVDGAHDKAVRRLGRPHLKLGRVRAIFVTAVEEADRAGGGVAEYLAGQDRVARFRTVGPDAPPPDADMVDVLRRAFPFHAPWRLLDREGGGRAHIARTPARMNRGRGTA